MTQSWERMDMTRFPSAGDQAMELACVQFLGRSPSVGRRRTLSQLKGFHVHETWKFWSRTRTMSPVYRTRLPLSLMVLEVEARIAVSPLGRRWASWLKSEIEG